MLKNSMVTNLLRTTSQYFRLARSLCRYVADAQASEDVEEHDGHELAQGDVAVAEAHASEDGEELDGRELAQDEVIALPVGQRLVSLRPRPEQMLKNSMVVNLLRTKSKYSRFAESLCR